MGSDLRRSNEEALPNYDVLGYDRMELQGNHYRYSLPVARLTRCRVLSISGAPETDEEREEALRQIAILNGEIDVREKALNAAWKTTAEWRELWEHELQAGREMKAAAKQAGTLPGKATHSYKGKKFKLNNIPKGKKGGIDTWR